MASWIDRLLGRAALVDRLEELLERYEAVLEENRELRIGLASMGRFAHGVASEVTANTSTDEGPGARVAVSGGGPEEKPAPRRTLDTRRAAGILGLSEGHVRVLANAGKVPSSKVWGTGRAGFQYRFNRAELLEYGAGASGRNGRRRMPPPELPEESVVDDDGYARPPGTEDWITTREASEIVGESASGGLTQKLREAGVGTVRVRRVSGRRGPAWKWLYDPDDVARYAGVGAASGTARTGSPGDGGPVDAVSAEQVRDLPDALTFKQAELLTGIEVATLRRWAQTGRVRTVEAAVGVSAGSGETQKVVRVPKSEVLALRAEKRGAVYGA